jgi:hypothetical protein
MTRKQEGPLWLDVVHRLERAIGGPVESAVRSDTYFDLMAHAKRAGTRLTGFAESVSEEWLHLFNLPASSDVRKLREQVARMERELAQMAKELAERGADGEQAKPARSDRRSAASGPARTRSKARRKPAS